MAGRGRSLKSTYAEHGWEGGLDCFFQILRLATLMLKQEYASRLFPMHIFAVFNEPAEKYECGTLEGRVLKVHSYVPERV